MKIVHLTDLHYNKKHTTHQETLVSKLCVEINKIDKIDFLFFTGDLVDKGGDKGKQFMQADKMLFDQILNSTNITKDQIFICCGNHDVNRSREIPSITNYVNGINSIESLNQFVKDKRQFDMSLDNIKSYINYQNTFYSEVDNDVNKIYSTHVRTVNDKKVGIATINTAWRAADSDKDKGNLLFPPVLIDDIIKSLKECDVRIILMHHPLTDLKDFVFYDIESKIYNSFHLLFSGHVHMEKVETHITGDEGIFCCISPSSLTYGYQDARIGFTLIEVDDDIIYDAVITKYNYDKRSETFFKSNPISIQIPLDEEKRKQITLKTRVRNKLKEEIENANELFLSTYDDGKNEKNFLDLFTPPAIRTKSRTETTSTTDPTSIFNLTYLIY